MPGPSCSFLSSELQQVVFPPAILHQTVFAEAEKKIMLFWFVFFFTQKPCQRLWKIVCILFLVAAGCQYLGTHLISNPELRNPLQAGE